MHWRVIKEFNSFVNRLNMKRVQFMFHIIKQFSSWDRIYLYPIQMRNYIQVWFGLNRICKWMLWVNEISFLVQFVYICKPMMNWRWFEIRLEFGYELRIWYLLIGFKLPLISFVQSIRIYLFSMISRIQSMILKPLPVFLIDSFIHWTKCIDCTEFHPL